MRFTLINVPVRLNRPPYVFPVGPGSIAAALCRAGHEVAIVDANAERLPALVAAERASATDPQAVGISGLISTYGYQLELLAALRERLPDTPLIAGGGCASSVPELLFEHSPVDVLALGEGETTAVELARAIEDGGLVGGAGVSAEALCSVAGLGIREEAGSPSYRRTAPRALEQNLDRFGRPAHELFPTETYLEGNIWGFERAIPLISSRGCPMDCNFCFSIFGRRSYRRRSAEVILDEVRFLKRRYGVKFFSFVDDNLTINKRHLLEVCEGLAREGVAWGCHGRVDTADDERLAAMAASGCKWLGFGIESGSQRILDAMNKRAKVDQALEAIKRTQAHGIFPNTTYILGYPGEDEASVFETMSFMAKTEIVSNPFLATPYPGTPLYAEAKERGLVTDDHSFVLQLNDACDFTVNFTNFSDAKLRRLQRVMPHEVGLVASFEESTAGLGDDEFAAVADELLGRSYEWPEATATILRVVAERLRRQGNLAAAEQAARAARRFRHAAAPLGATGAGLAATPPV